ncbi:hypothetical protein Psuf_066770 [Phytohabitans suffuscus]|uniref:Polyketide synthase n=1 Tax=Phytohabitans suffuscus TaxID=624315 RepID=A0A6F8YTC0_9ACTN|nr:type I polyketide synthase [Phytohabitans suffuscus]BCB89364.1 hypothetical protein Psuf_066770 [Phytohabitans suffuscus]
MRPRPADEGAGGLRRRLTGLPAGHRPDVVAGVVRRAVAAVLGHPAGQPLDVRRSLKSLGFESLTVLELRNQLAAATGLRLAATLAFDHPTPAALADHLLERLVDGGATAAEPTGTATAAEPVDEPIAIVAMSCRFPGGVRSPEDLWRLVFDGVDAISAFPGDRGWSESLYDPDPHKAGHSLTREGGFLYDAADFDAEFFGISPREATAMDPQQRLLLELTWEALERAGVDPGTVRGRPVGVFVGAMHQEYGARWAAAPEGFEGHLMTGNTSSVISGRIAYTFGLQGPALTVDTACSSSLVALHLASQSLRRGECEAALVGGVTVMPTPYTFVEFSRQGGLAPDGRCKPFAAAADGTGWAEGAGMLLVERLSEARRHGHRVLAVLRGSAVNQDGASNGLSAPSGPAQRRVIRAALASARLAPSEVDAVEAHGTGTTLGDPIEATALLAAYGERSADRPLWLGSVKSNIGHTQAASGMAGIIKMVQAMRHGVLPASLHVDSPSPHVDWSAGAVSLLTERIVWPESGRPRRAGVSAFGVSGTNAHILLEGVEPPEEPAEPDGTVVPWLVSAASAAALAAQGSRLAAHLAGARSLDVGYSLGLRADLPHRAVVWDTAGLAALGAGTEHPDLVRGVAGDGRPVFVFPGQGSQWLGMGLELWGSSPVFASSMEACAVALAPYVEWDLRSVLADELALARVDVVQPALFAVMVSLAALWRSYRVEPVAVVGHSQGEIAAAYVAGGLSLEDAARVVALRSRAITALAGRGGMVSVPLPLDGIDPGELSVAAVNGPESVVLSGDVAAVEAFLAGEPRARRVNVDYASHSPQVEAVEDDILAALAGISPRSGQVPFYSTVDGAVVDTAVLDAGYWYRNLRQTVRFADAVAGLPGHVFVEVSAHPVLGLGLGTLRRDEGGVERVLASLAQAWTRGVAVDWAPAYAGRRPRRIELPTYPFQRQRYWLEAPTPARDAAPAAEGPERYRSGWMPAADPHPTRLDGRWLLVSPDGGSALAAVLAAHGADVATLPVHSGDRAGLAAPLRAAAGERAVAGVLADLPELADAVALAQALGDADIAAPLWLVTRGAVAAAPGDPVDAPEQAMIWGFGRVLGLEHADRWGGLVDLPARLDERAGARLAGVLAAADEDQVAIRAGGVFLRRLRPAAAPAGTPWRPRGTVLITGGTGALGGHVARWAAGAGASRLVLLSRRGPDAPGASALRDEIAALGAEAVIRACDVADREALAAVVGEYPPDAVVHTAAALDDAVVAAVRPEQLDRAWRAKGLAARHLDDLLGDRPLDAFVLFSSVAGTLGMPGQATYAPPNAYLDALAERRRARGAVATSIAWGAWGGGGLAAIDEVADLLDRHGLPRMEPAATLAALGVAAGEPEPTVAIVDIAWDRFYLAFTASRARPLLHAIPQVRRLRAERERAGPSSGLAERLADAGPDERYRAVLALVRTHAAAALGHAGPERVAPERSFKELGNDSLTGVDIRNRLAAATGLRLPAALVYDHPTPAALAAHLVSLTFGAGGVVGERAAAVAAGDPIAVVGMGCRFPGGVDSPEKLWDLVAGGVDAMGPFPTDRGWSDDLYHPDPDHRGTSYVDMGAFLADACGFDAEFFGISPREAVAMDPQQRLLLETAWEAIERAGIDPASLRGTDAGVFAGTNGQDYPALLAGVAGDAEGYVITGSAASVFSGRIAYALGLEGPALTVDTACSSSLVALHLAAQSLRQGECHLALVGAATVMATPSLFVEFSRQRGMAADGRCKAFAAAADGTGWGEGAGVLVLERLSDARRHGHPVLAVLDGSAVNQDGASNGLTAPNGPAQQKVIRAALANAGLTASDVDAVEGHGTGTTLGDPIEAQALLATYGQDRDRPLWLGSVKSNIGHTQAAAGVAGLIKMIEALRHGVLPRSLHVDAPTPHVDWSAGDVRLLTSDVAWQARPGSPRRFGISSFGISGTNAHAILSAPSPEGAAAAAPAPAGAVLPYLVSGHTAEALRAQAARLREHLAAVPSGELAGVAFALGASRAALGQRAAVVAADRDELLAGLAALAEGRPAGHLVHGRPVGVDGRLAVLFTGQGSQRLGMGERLYAAHPGYAAAFDEVCAHLDRHLERPLREVIATDAEALDGTGYAQPALFAVEVALYRLLTGWGLKPALLAGHSIGELAAAHVAEVLDLPSAAELVAARGRLMQALPRSGAMVAVAAAADEVRPLLAEHGSEVDLAAINGLESTVLSGDRERVEAVAAVLRERGRKVKRLRVSHAFHSPLIEPMLAEFRAVADRLAFAPPRIPIVSTVTGAPLTDAQACDPAYWVEQARRPVDFLGAVRRLTAEGVTTCLEIGPDAVLAPLAEECASVSAVPALRADRAEDATLMAAVGALSTLGFPVAWPALLPGVRPAALPTYAFQHRRFWPRTSGGGAAAAAGWRYRVAWTALPPPAPEPVVPDRTWLVVTPADGGAADVVAGLARRGLRMRTVAVPAGAVEATLAEVVESEWRVGGVLSLLALGTSGQGTADTLALVRALPALDLDAPLWLVTRGAVEAPWDTAQAAVWGLGRVLSLEQPGRWGGLVDLPEQLDDRRLHLLLAALAGAFAGEDQLAIGAGVRARRVLRAAPGAARWRPRGTVLITGGTGALGAHVARWAARAGAGQLVLASRRGDAAPGAAELREELVGLGARVTIAACDTADRAALAALVERYPPDAVVHAAGLVRERPLAETTTADLAELAAGKSVAARHLDALLDGVELDAFVLFSSISGIWGSGGQGAYAAANAELDAIAAARRARAWPPPRWPGVRGPAAGWPPTRPPPGCGSAGCPRWRRTPRWPPWPRPWPTRSRSPWSPTWTGTGSPPPTPRLARARCWPTCPRRGAP